MLKCHIENDTKPEGEALDLAIRKAERSCRCRSGAQGGEPDVWEELGKRPAAPKGGGRGSAGM